MRAPAFAVLVSAVALAACGGGGGGSDSGVAPQPTPTPSPTTPATSGPTITIQGMRFSPTTLQVAPGAVVTVRNLDGMAHSVTSQATPGAFVAGGVAGIAFDTGAFVGTASFTIPATAAVGTVIPFFCSTHSGLMVTPNGEIRVASNPAPAPVETPTPDPGPMY